MDGLCPVGITVVLPRRAEGTLAGRQLPADEAALRHGQEGPN